MVAKTDVSTRKRQPSGVPIGGEFAANEHDEATSSLADFTTTARGTKLENKKALTPRELFAEAKKAASVYGERKNLTPDECEEAAQATLEDVWKSYGAKGKEIDGALVNHVARIQVGKTIRGGRKALVGDNAMAATEFEGEVEYRSAELGRELTSRERDEIAADIRDNWHDQAHKPTDGFHLHASREKSLDFVPGSYDGDDYVHHSLVDPYSPEAAFESQSSAEIDAALDRLSGEVRPDGDKPVSESKAVNQNGEKLSQVRSELRSEAWRLVSSSAGAPPVTAKLSEAHQKITRAAVSKAGGVSSIIDSYDRGETGGAVDAMFVPFAKPVISDGKVVGHRPASEAERESIVDAMRQHRSLADSLWASALASAK